jgi:tetratricopeptide (TPR) repeat protein
LADSLIKADQYEKGLELLNKLISTYGEKEQYLSDRGLAHLATNNPINAKADFLKALTLNPECTRCLGNLGIIEVDNKNFSDAISYLEKYIKLKPNEAMGYVKRGEARFHTGKYDDAIADFNRGLELDINSPYIYLYRSMTQLAKGDNKAAMDDINKSIQYKPEAEFAYFIKGKIYIQMGDYKSAIKDLFGCLRKNPNVPEYNTYAGIALYYINDYTKAMQAFDASLKLDSSDHLPFQFRSYILYSYAAFTKACIDKQRALTVASAGGNTEAVMQLQQEIDEYCDLSKPGGHYHSGAVLFGQADFEKAKLAYSNGLRQFPNDPLLLEGRGNTAMATGQFSEALGYYNQCLSHVKEINTGLLTKETDPEKKKASLDFFLSQVYNSMAYASMNLMKIDSAILYQGKAIDILKNNFLVNDRIENLSQFLIKRSTLFTLKNDYVSAEADITEVLSINPQSAQAYVERATHLINKNTFESGVNIDSIKSVFQPKDKSKFSMATTPSKNSKKEEIEAAFENCNKSIEINPAFAQAYLIRAQAAILLKKNNYCADILQAKKLGIKEADSMLGVSCK